MASKEALVGRRRAARWTVAAGIVSSFVLVTPLAAASWSQSGAGTLSASATTIDPVAQAPSVVAQGNAVRVTWTASSLANGAPVDGYRVLRHVDDVVTTVCSTAQPTALSCDDTSPVTSGARYGVVAYKANWSASESPLSAAVVADALPPTTSLTRVPAGSDGSWAREDVRITLRASDDSGSVREIRYVLNQGTETVVPGATAELTVSREDANTLQFWAVDGAGNVEDPKNTAGIKIDKTAPVTTATPSGTLGNGWYRSDVTLTLAATDTSPVNGGSASTVNKVEYQLNGTSGAWTTYTSPVTITSEGSTTVHYRAVDVAGNTETSKSVVVRIDRTAPSNGSVTASQAPNASGWYAAPVTLTGLFTDSASGISAYQYATASPGPYSASSEGYRVGTEGVQTVWARAIDAAGNISAPVSREVKVDLTQPIAPTDIAPTASGSGPFSAGSPWPSVSDCAAGQVCATTSDALSGIATVTYTLTRNDGSCWAGSGWATTGCTRPMTATAVGSSRYKSSGASPVLQPGNRSYTLTIVATDHAGLTKSETVTFASR